MTEDFFARVVEAVDNERYQSAISQAICRLSKERGVTEMLLVDLSRSFQRAEILWREIESLPEFQEYGERYRVRSAFFAYQKQSDATNKNYDE